MAFLNIDKEICSSEWFLIPLHSTKRLKFAVDDMKRSGSTALVALLTDNVLHIVRLFV
jgi:hypothetical protein